jgi:hypothetical protein
MHDFAIQNLDNQVASVPEEHWPNPWVDGAAFSITIVLFAFVCSFL